MNPEQKRLFKVMYDLHSEMAKSGGKPTRITMELEQELNFSLKTQEAKEKLSREYERYVKLYTMKKDREFRMQVSLVALGYVKAKVPLPLSLVAMACRFGRVSNTAEALLRMQQRIEAESASSAASAVVVKKGKKSAVIDKPKKSKSEKSQRSAAVGVSSSPVVKTDWLDDLMASQRARCAVSDLGVMSVGLLQVRVRQQLFYLEPVVQLRHELQENQQRAMFASIVVAHAKDLKEFWTFQRDVRLEVAEQMKKKGAAREIETLKRLKSTNLESYLEELRGRKDERIQMILDQTQDCLEKIIGKLEVANRNVFAKIGSRKSAELLAGSLQSMIFGHAKTVKEPTGLGEGGDLRLKNYQLEGLRWLASLDAFNLNGILADEMGLGKTVQTIAFLMYLKERNLVKRPHLIVAPTNVLPNWLQELRMWAPRMVVAEWSARIPISERLSHFNEKVTKAEVVVTTYEFIRNHQKAKTIEKWGKLPHLSKVKWHVIVVDEAHHINNNSSQVAKALRKFNCIRKFLLTGTPLQNDLQDLWALLNYLMPEVFSSESDFDQWFESPFGEEKTEMTHEEKTLIILRLHKVLAPFMLRRVKSDVASDLPDVIERTLACDFSELQQLMSEFVSRGEVPALPADEDGSAARRNSSNAGMSAVGGNNLLRKVCNHPFLVYTEQGSSTSFPWHAFKDFDTESFIRASGKFVVLDVLLKKLKLCDHRVLIYSPWTQTLELLAELLRRREYRFLELTGATTGENRDRLIREFNTDASIFAFLVSTHAGGEGVNLQVADTVIIFESDWNPQRDKQAKARVHRLGQERKVLCLNLVTVGEEFESQDQRKFGRADDKRKMEELVIGAGNFVEHTTDRDRVDTVSSMYREEEQDGLQFRRTDELDRLICRDEDELKKLASNPISLPPLLRLDELPQWIKTPSVKRRKEDGVVLDGAVRKRKVVSYKEQKINSDEESSSDEGLLRPMDEREEEEDLRGREEEEEEEEEVHEQEHEDEDVGVKAQAVAVPKVKVVLKRPRSAEDQEKNREFMDTFTTVSYQDTNFSGIGSFDDAELGDWGGDLGDFDWMT